MATLVYYFYSPNSTYIYTLACVMYFKIIFKFRNSRWLTLSLNLLKCVLIHMKALWEINMCHVKERWKDGKWDLFISQLSSPIFISQCGPDWLAPVRLPSLGKCGTCLTLSMLSYLKKESFIWVRPTWSQIQAVYLQTFPPKRVITVPADDYMPNALLPMRVIIIANIYSSHCS